MGSAVAEPVVEKGRSQDQSARAALHVVLLDDDDHTYEYVIEMLQKLFACSQAQSLEPCRGGGHHGPYHRR